MHSSPLKQQVSQMMRQIRQGRLPSSQHIVKEAFADLNLSPEQISRDDARKNFGVYLWQVWQHTLTVLERYEQHAYAKGIPTELAKMLPKSVEDANQVGSQSGFRDGAVHLMSEWYPYLREAFLSVSQSRKQRGGGDFELQFGGMLRLAQIPYQEVRRAYRVDFMIPSDDKFRQNKTVAVIASAKRTLRERWREVVEELQAMRSPNIFLVTANGEVGQGHVRAICHSYQIHLVVWDEVKERLYADEPLVLGYTEWANQRIPALEQFW